MLVTRFNAGSTVELINPSQVSPRHKRVEILILDRSGSTLTLTLSENALIIPLFGHFP